jgi:hypothetical protein
VSEQKAQNHRTATQNLSLRTVSLKSTLNYDSASTVLSLHTSGLYLGRMVILNDFFLLQSFIHSNNQSIILSVFFYFLLTHFHTLYFLFISLSSPLFIFYSPFLSMLTKESFYLKLFIKSVSLYFSPILNIYFLPHKGSYFSNYSCIDLSKPSRFKISALTRQIKIYVLKNFCTCLDIYQFIRQYLRPNPICFPVLPF